ncbi:MAG: uvrC [Chlamydiales bacterium]|jgi:excinuclease ABC subunit C|nr:uvrC [Chlamydiales bacterium]
MKIEDVANYPTQPGVYLMKDAAGEVLYIGKAKNLRVRIKQYFSGHDTRAMITYLMAQLVQIEVIVVLTEKEALLLENTLIKKHQPRYNVLLKDDKGFIRLRVNHKHPWPQVQFVRHKGPLKDDALYFGPYLSAYAAYEVLELVQKLFPLRRCSDNEVRNRTRPCLLHQMKRCLAPCVNKCTSEEYQDQVQSVVHFLKGKTQGVMDHLQEQINVASERLEFERAGELYKKLLLIKQFVVPQVVDQIVSINQDVIGIYREADDIVLSQLFIRQGKVIGVQHYPFSQLIDEDIEIIESFLMQHYSMKEDLPNQILLPMELTNLDAVEEALADGHKPKIKFITPQRGAKADLIEMAHQNAMAAFKKEKDVTRSKERVLLEMQDLLHLQNYPHRIECFDNSHLAGTMPVSAMVVYQNGFKAPQQYRKFHLKTVDPSDDYGAMYEVLSRRYKRAKEEDNLPSLIVIDGGKGQLNIGLKVLSELNIIGVDIIGLAKESGRHDKGGTQEQIFLPNKTQPTILPKNSPILFFLQQIRDEAHRVVITFQRNTRSRKTIGTQLDQVPGIGPIKKQRLLSHFGSLKQIQQASDDDLASIQGMTKKDILAIRKFSEQKQTVRK